MTSRPRFSIIMPTFQRRETVVSSVQALAHQSFEGEFEVIVVVDGSTDGSAEALRSVSRPFACKVIEQPNQGAASARNRGAANATGEVLLFLDDDMEADPTLLQQHDRSHKKGAEVVLGHVPLHPKSPQNFLSDGVGAWADDRARQLSQPGNKLRAFDVLTGQLSIRREIFEALGGFDTNFTRGGAFGNEDLDFGVRLMNGGYRLVFNPAAISYQRYVVSFRQHLDQWRDVGRADVSLARRHPEQVAAIRSARSMSAPLNRILKRIHSLPLIGRAATRSVASVALALANKWPRSKSVSRLFFAARELAYGSGVAEQGGLPNSGSLRVLSYHSIDVKSVGGELAEYSIHPDTFERQIILLRDRGFTFVSPKRALAAIEGCDILPRRSVLITFDDGYSDFVKEAVPILKKHAIPAVVFVVTAHLGEANHWDADKGAPTRELMSAKDLRTLGSASIEVGAHSRSHRSLTGLPPEEIAEEIAGSLVDLEKLQLNPLKLFCYPYGEMNDVVEREAVAAGVRAAFTVASGTVTDSVERLQIPRIEILKSDGSGPRFLWKVMNGGSAIRPGYWLR